MTDTVKQTIIDDGGDRDEEMHLFKKFLELADTRFMCSYLEIIFRMFDTFNDNDNITEHIGGSSKEMLKLTDRLFSKYFIEGELFRSMDYQISFPAAIAMDSSDDEKTVPFISTITSNYDHISPAEVICAYRTSTREFVWHSPSLKTISNKWFKGIDIAENNFIRNVSMEDAQEMAIWFRAMYYESNIEYFNERLQGVDHPDHIHITMKTNNLVKFSVPTDMDSAEEIVVFALVDLGIPDPACDKKMSATLGVFRIAHTVITNPE